MNVTAAVPVTESSQVGEVRRTVLWLASRLGFSEEQSGRAALVGTELATNLAKHARSGEMLIRPLSAPDGDQDGIELLALDKGPGLSDLALARRDGFSTSGTLGQGLGAIERQSDHFEIYTQPSGTVIAARFRRADRGAHGPADQHPLEVGAVHVSKPGENICGDAWGWRMREGRLAIFVADGLGHGAAAHDAAAAAVRVFSAQPELGPARLIEDVHAALRPTRGAAVASLAVNLERGTAAFAGLGNISAMVLTGTSRQHMFSHNGTAGHTAARIREFSYPVPQNSIIVMFSDGLGTHWDLAAYPGLQQRSASVIAGVLFRDFSRRRDDVTVIVARERTGIAEKL